MTDLTILLTLKDRKKFTKRWLDWMALEECPYKILLADGDADKSYTKALIKDLNYRNLDIDHIEFPEDKDIQTFIKKFNDSVSLIKTKYAICADNDDFLIIKNLRDALTYFNKSSDIETLALPHYRVRIKNKTQDIESNMYSDGNEVEFQMLNYLPTERFNRKSATKRLRESVKFFPSDYFVYSIHKTENFRKFIALTTEYPIEYIFFWERHFTYSVGIIGSIDSGVSLEPFLVRQEDTSMLASSLVETEKLIKIRYSAAWSRQYPRFIDGLYKMVIEYRDISYLRFSLVFSSYFILNTYIRSIQGLIGSIVKPFRRLYLLLSGLLRWTLGKNRIDLDQIEVSENRALLKLTAFLEHGSN